jgi:hypothetical protein
VVVSCEHGNETSGFLKGEEFFLASWATVSFIGLIQLCIHPLDRPTAEDTAF